MNNKSSAREKIKFRIRKKINGVAAKPRLSVFRSNADIYAQLINDENGATLLLYHQRIKILKPKKLPKLKRVNL